MTSLTAKQVIRLRCLDCHGHKCENEDCPLYGLMRPKAGARRPKAIREYCWWCMNDNPINQCYVCTCSIYQYRAKARGNLHVQFLPVELNIDDNGGTYEIENEVSSGVKIGVRSNVINDDLRKAV